VAYGLPWYGINPNGGYEPLFYPSSHGILMADLARPAETLMISEKGAGGGYQYILAYRYYACRDDHNEGGNIAFFDGHVKWHKFEKGPIGHGYTDPPYNDAYAIHPPWQTIWDPYGKAM